MVGRRGEAVVANMRRVYQATGLVLLAIAVALIYGASSMQYYSSLGPGPGFFPLWLSVALAGLSIIMIVQASFGAADSMPADYWPDRAGVLRVVGLVLALAGAVAGLERLGFAITIFLMNVFALRLLGQKSLLATLIISTVASFGVYYFFTKWLSVPLPAGLLAA